MFQQYKDYPDITELWRRASPASILLSALDLSPYTAMIAEDRQKYEIKFFLAGYSQQFRESLYLAYVDSALTPAPLYCFGRCAYVSFDRYEERPNSEYFGERTIEIEGRFMNEKLFGRARKW